MRLTLWPIATSARGTDSKSTLACGLSLLGRLRQRTSPATAFLYSTGLMAMFAICGCAGSTVSSRDYADLYSDDGLQVQSATIKYTNIRDIKAIPHIIENLDHRDLWIRKQSATALHELTRNQVHLGSPGTSDIELQRLWRQWYKESSEEFFARMKEQHEESLNSSSPTSKGQNE